MADADWKEADDSEDAAQNGYAQLPCSDDEISNTGSFDVAGQRLAMLEADYLRCLSMNSQRPPRRNVDVDTFASARANAESSSIDGAEEHAEVKEGDTSPIKDVSTEAAVKAEGEPETFDAPAPSAPAPLAELSSAHADAIKSIMQGIVLAPPPPETAAALKAADKLILELQRHRGKP
jgi:hypothetical protein